jgi:uncharacterized GH25 family protein
VVADLHASGDTSNLEVKVYKAAVIAGRVLDSQGRPVAGITVSVLGLGGQLARMVPSRVRAGETNDLGQYRITVSVL